MSGPDHARAPGPLGPDLGGTAETADEERLLATLGRRARTVNLARVVRLLALLDAAEVDGLDEAGREEAENLAHQVVGSAGTFGHPAASEAAVVVEDWFAADRPRCPGSTVGTVRSTLDRLRTDFEGRPQP